MPDENSPPVGPRLDDPNLPEWLGTAPTAELAEWEERLKWRESQGGGSDARTR